MIFRFRVEIVLNLDNNLAVGADNNKSGKADSLHSFPIGQDAHSIRLTDFVKHNADDDDDDLKMQAFAHMTVPTIKDANIPRSTLLLIGAFFVLTLGFFTSLVRKFCQQTSSRTKNFVGRHVWLETPILDNCLAQFDKVRYQSSTRFRFVLTCSDFSWSAPVRQW